VRRHTGWGPRLVAGRTAHPHSTVWKVLHRQGLSRRQRSPREAARRYEWPCPGDLLHIDTARYARFERPGHALTGVRDKTGAEKRARWGYDFAHAIVDDHSRLAYVELLPDERAATVTAFVTRALDWFQARGIHAKRLTSDNAWNYVKNQSLRELLATRQIKHLRTQAYRPQTNGKVERFQPTAHTTIAAAPCHTGSSTTTRAGHTQGSATGRPSAAFTTYVGRTASRSKRTAAPPPPRPP
jgi:transposase InsO family protein